MTPIPRAAITFFVDHDHTNDYVLLRRSGVVHVLRHDEVLPRSC